MKKYSVRVLFRLFDRDQVPVEMEFEDDTPPLVYSIKQRIKRRIDPLFIQDTTPNEDADNRTCIFYEISIDNGNRVTIYKYKRAKWNNYNGKMRFRNQRTGEELVRTKQVV